MFQIPGIHPQTPSGFHPWTPLGQSSRRFFNFHCSTHCLRRLVTVDMVSNLTVVLFSGDIFIQIKYYYYY